MDALKTLLWKFWAHEIKVLKINMQVIHPFLKITNNDDCPFFII